MAAAPQFFLLLNLLSGAVLVGSSEAKSKEWPGHAVVPWKPDSCGPVKKRCSHDGDCPKGCGSCTCETGGGGPSIVPPKCQNAYGGDAVHGFCTNPVGNQPNGKCGGAPIPIENYAKGKKQYLMIGDSVAGIVFRPLNHSLTNGSMPLTIQPYIIPINGGDSRTGVDCVAEWVGTDMDRWDAISMNFGMHNIGPSDVNNSKDPKTGKYVDEKLEAYVDGLRNISVWLLKTRAGQQKNLIWVSTNPTALSKECCNDPHVVDPEKLGTHTCTKGIEVYNEAAWEVLQPLGFKIADFYKAANDRCGKNWAYNCDVIPQKQGGQCQVHPGGPGPDFFAKLIIDQLVKVDAESSVEARLIV